MCRKDLQMGWTVPEAFWLDWKTSIVVLYNLSNQKLGAKFWSEKLKPNFWTWKTRLCDYKNILLQLSKFEEKRRASNMDINGRNYSMTTVFPEGTYLKQAQLFLVRTILEKIKSCLNTDLRQVLLSFHRSKVLSSIFNVHFGEIGDAAYVHHVMIWFFDANEVHVANTWNS